MAADGIGPLELGAARPDAGALDSATRERLLDATGRLVRQLGTARTSMADVARTAGVARGTLYRYFDSKQALLDAVSQRATDRFFEAVAAAMAGRSSLSEQLGTFAEAMIRSIHPDGGEPADNQASMIRLLVTQGPQALRRTARFLRPHLEAARSRGEVRPDLDVDDAGEWLARVLLSFAVFQASIAYAADDPRSVASFVRRYAIDGLTGRG